MTSVKHTNLKFVVIGDGSIGKTCLLSVYSKGEFPIDYVPTVVDNFTVQVNIDGKPVSVNLWDTAGQENFDSFRSLSYPDTDAFIICFSLVIPFSLDNVIDKWYPEIKERKAKIILVGTQSDKMNDTKVLKNLESFKLHIPTNEQIQKVADKIGAYKYISTSAKENIGVENVFVQAIRACIATPPTLAKRKTGLFDSSSKLSDVDDDLNMKLKKKL
jgi:small GTP-binding protein